MKKFSAIVLCLLMMVTFTLSGCAGFSINYVRYYNEVVATVGNTKITRYELLNAYSSYGQSYYVEQMGQEASEALNSTLDLLIDRELLYQYAKADEKYALTEKQVNDAVQALFDSFDSQMETYVGEAKSILNIDVDEEDETTEDEEESLPYSDYVYTPRAIVVDEIVYYTDANMTEISETPTEYSRVVSKIKYVASNEDNETFDALIDRKFLSDYTLAGLEEEILDKYLAHFKSSLVNEDKCEEIKNKAISLLAQDLINYEYYLRDENGNKYNTNTRDLLIRFIERNFESQIESQYLENIRVYYLVNEDLSINELLEEFKTMAQISYIKYKNHEDTYKTDMKDIGTSGDTILWHNTNLSDGTQFGYFTHTLLSFSTAQQNMKTALDKEVGLTDEQYNARLLEIISAGEYAERDPETGELTGDTKSFSDIMAEYKSITQISNYQERLSQFTQFMFKYTGDTATLSAGMPYVVGTNDNSSMEEAFTNEAVRLIQDGVRGGMSKVVDENIGSADDLCVTSYGVHLLFYVGNVDEYDVPITNIDGVYISENNKAGAENGNLYYKVINPLTNETYFDMLFDEVYPASSDEDNYTSNTGYTDYEQSIITNYKNVVQVTKNTSKIEGTRI